MGVIYQISNSGVLSDAKQRQYMPWFLHAKMISWAASRVLLPVLRHHPPESVLVFVTLCLAVFLHLSGQALGAYFTLALAYAMSLAFYFLNAEFIVEDFKKPKAASALHTPDNVTRTDIDMQHPGAFKDSSGRRVTFRGINVGGDCKTPVLTNQSLHSDAEVSFVGKPFDLVHADEHFSRIRAWGFTLVRLVVTWEAVEHRGPGKYDEEYLDYLQALVRKGAQHDLCFVIDPHQDVWSRWTGGCGAPRWTLEAVGFDPDHLHESGAAFTEHGFFERQIKEGGAEPYPQMTWPSNHHRLGCATMFTLFFGGNDFAPGVCVGDVGIQDFLQGHFIGAMVKVAETLRSEKNVLGFETMNEPNLGYIGYRDLSQPSKFLLQGHAPTFFESFLLGEGFATKVKYYEPSLVHAGYRTLNEHGVRAWKVGVSCIWRSLGLWEVDGTAKLLKPDYFVRRSSDLREVDPLRDYFIPFANRFAGAIREVSADYGIFVVKPSDFESSSIATLPTDCNLHSVALAPHWYDIVTVVTKSFRGWVGVGRSCDSRFPVVFGNHNLVNEYKRQLLSLSAEAMNIGQGLPCIVGELGCPMDLGARTADGWDEHMQVSAWNTTLSAAEEASLSFCIWNYTSSNSNKTGDGWNGENFSVFCRDNCSDSSDVFSGGRALRAIIRPYAFRCPGAILKTKFCIHSRVFTVRFNLDHNNPTPLVLFVPFYQYSSAPQVNISDGYYALDRERQTLLFFADQKAPNPHELKISPGL